MAKFILSVSFTNSEKQQFASSSCWLYHLHITVLPFTDAFLCLIMKQMIIFILSCMSFFLSLVCLHSISTPGKNYFQLRRSGCVSFQSNCKWPYRFACRKQNIFPLGAHPLSSPRRHTRKVIWGQTWVVSVPTPCPHISGQEEVSV